MIIRDGRRIIMDDGGVSSNSFLFCYGHYGEFQHGFHFLFFYHFIILFTILGRSCCMDFIFSLFLFEMVVTAGWVYMVAYGLHFNGN